LATLGRCSPLHTIALSQARRGNGRAGVGGRAVGSGMAREFLVAILFGTFIYVGRGRTLAAVDGPGIAKGMNGNSPSPFWRNQG